MSKPRKTPSNKKVNGYKMPKQIPNGEVLKDNQKKEWVIGASIGKGGFGEIYEAKLLEAKSNEYPYIVKIEPHENGPLFVEMHFYVRNAKKEDIEAFKQEKKLKFLGMPVFIASGSHTYQNEKYRFLVLEKYETDVWKLFVENKKQMPPVTAYNLGFQMIDVLEYIHSKGYTHGDLKGANILLKGKCQAYLVDFGLASKYTTDSVFKENPKKMHDGTIEYLSRDAHLGVQTRRGDIEVLAYNLIHWLSGKLPWEKILKDPLAVQGSKQQNMDNVKKFLLDCFGDNSPASIEKLLNYINKLEFNDVPDYKELKNILLAGLKSAGGSPSSELIFATANKRKSTGAIDGSEAKNRKGNNGVLKSLNGMPAKRTRRVNTVSTVDDLKSDKPIVMTAEAQRIRKLIDEKAKKISKPKKKMANGTKSNDISDGYSDIDESEVEKVLQQDLSPRPRRIAAARATLKSKKLFDGGNA